MDSNLESHLRAWPARWFNGRLEWVVCNGAKPVPLMPTSRDIVLKAPLSSVVALAMEQTLTDYAAQVETFVVVDQGVSSRPLLRFSDSKSALAFYMMHAANALSMSDHLARQRLR